MLGSDGFMPEIASRLLVDAVSAACASAGISPIIFAIDKSIMEAASGKSTSIVHSLRHSGTQLLKSPVAFFTSLPFILLYSVYFSTYMTANVYDTLSNIRAKDWAEQSSDFGKFLATTSVNLSSCVYKDFHYAKLFGTGPPRKMPGISLLLFAARDSLTVFASFNVPPLVAPFVGLNLAQLATPCAMQLLSTPMHLMGLDVYNRSKVGLRDRLGVVRGGYVKSTVARICRILPAFGIAGIVNRDVRTYGMHMVNSRVRT